MDELQYFVSGQLAVRFSWGVDDCITLAADWVRRVLEFDPMQDLRGRYDSLSSCERMTGFLTDPLRLVADRMRGCAVVDPGGQQRGDVGLVLSPLAGGMHAHGAIYLGKGLWVARAPKGITTMTPHKVLRVWRVGMRLREG